MIFACKIGNLFNIIGNQPIEGRIGSACLPKIQSSRLALGVTSGFFLKERRGEMRSHVSFISILALVVICVSCGGGGGGGGDDGGGGVSRYEPAPGDSPAATQPAVAGFVAGTALGGLTAGSLGTVVIASADSARQSNFEFNLLLLTQDTVDRVWTMHQKETLAAAASAPRRYRRASTAPAVERSLQFGTTRIPSVSCRRETV